VKGEPPQIIQPRSLADQFKDLQQAPPAVSHGLYLALRIVAGLLVAALVVIVFALAYRRLRSSSDGEDEADETRELILSAGLLKAQLARLFAGRKEGAHSRPFVMVAGDDPAAQGLPRLPGTTPSEYALLLSSARPADGDAIAARRRVYLESRYAGVSLSPASAERAALAWQEIAGAGRPATNGGSAIGGSPESA
jgi:hypothetical protein